jgi:hypothetical protein
VCPWKKEEQEIMEEELDHEVGEELKDKGWKSMFMEKRRAEGKRMEEHVHGKKEELNVYG